MISEGKAVVLAFLAIALTIVVVYTLAFDAGRTYECGGMCGGLTEGSIRDGVCACVTYSPPKAKP